jgi:fatty acid desaturase
MLAQDESTPEAGPGTRHGPDEKSGGLAKDLDALFAQTRARMGQQDLAYIRRMQQFSRAMEVIGRLAIHFSVEPCGFFAGVLALGVHKQLQWIEIGHTVLHGTYDRLEGVGRFSSKHFRWDLPLDEQAWRESHNFKHHGSTGIVGADPDLDMCALRFSPHTRWELRHAYQIPLMFGLVAPSFGLLMSAHVAELYQRPARWSSCRKAVRRALLYYLKEYVLFPALAGPFFIKVACGNLLAEVFRDVFSSLTFACGHIAEELETWPAGTRARSRGEWYAMQIEGTQNYEVGWALSVLAGGVDRHIEHHLFPRLPPQRLREIAPRVREICERHGVRYRSRRWTRNLRSTVRQLSKLARKPSDHSVRSKSE